MRCLKERFEEANAVIELNGLKIAEDRSFADLARYMMTTLLQVGNAVAAGCVCVCVFVCAHGRACHEGPWAARRRTFRILTHAALTHPPPQARTHTHTHTQTHTQNPPHTLAAHQ
jgi:hypothetical protein